MARFTPWNKTKDCYVSEASTLRKREANKGRSRLPRRLRDTFEEHRSFIGRNVLVPSSVFFFYTTSAPTSSSSSAHDMADQNVAVKKADPLPRPLVRPSPHLLRSRSPPVERRTNDQRNVNRKPREATLINPTEINCNGAPPSPSHSLVEPLLLFARTDSTTLDGVLRNILSLKIPDQSVIKYRRPNQIKRV